MPKNKKLDEIKEITQKIIKLQEQQEKLMLEIKSQEIYRGFKLTQSKDGKGTTQWKGYKYQNGRQWNVYLGANPLEWEKKIDEYIGKRFQSK